MWLGRIVIVLMPRIERRIVCRFMFSGSLGLVGGVLALAWRLALLIHMTRDFELNSRSRTSFDSDVRLSWPIRIEHWTRPAPDWLKRSPFGIGLAEIIATTVEKAMFGLIVQL